MRAFAWLLPFAICSVISAGVTVEPLMAQATDADQESNNTFCTFEDGKEISARYKPIDAGRTEGPPLGKVWMPGGSAMTFFTNAEVTLGNTLIPVGAYTMYVIPGKKDWTLIISKNVTVDRKYEEGQDLVRVPMETGKLSQAEAQLRVTFVHLGPKQCELNLDFGRSRAWVAFKEK
jgi:hypothetical protein